MEGLWDNILAASIVILAMIAILGVIFGVLNYRGVKKKRTHFEDLHKRLKSGQTVVTSAGIYGKLLKVTDETVDMEVKSGAVFTVSRFAISEIVTDGKKNGKEKASA